MDKRVGVLGGGQLGRMFVEAANRLNVHVNFLDAAGSSAKQISNHDGHIEGSFKDPQSIKDLAANSDVVTVEIEHVDTYMLEDIAKTVDVQPSWKTIRMIQDKYEQKEHLLKNGIAVAESLALNEPTTAELKRAASMLGLPFMLKSRREAYDGRGNFPVKSEADFDAALKALGANKTLYAEKWANFRMELAVMVVKTKDDVLSFPTVETIHENSICKLVYAPARGVSKPINEAAQSLARQAVACFSGKGVFGVEMFLLPDDTLLINEIAPRPHNSGHYTIEACPISQYAAHLRAILDLPIHASDLQLSVPAAIMLNILGGSDPDSHTQFATAALKNPRTSIHLYGKGSARPGRKMGHVTLTANSMYEAETLLAPLLLLDNPSSPPPPKPLSSPQIAITMGSDSDLPVLTPALALLDDLSIPYTLRITSAHRTPHIMAQFATQAESHGIRVILAAAGGAAHLPGMLASHTSLPVIGIPVKPTVGDGTDSLLSIVNMPKGVPVATVGVNNSLNAVLLALRVLGVQDERVRGMMTGYMEKNAGEVRAKDGRLGEVGWRGYLEGMKK